MLGIDFNAVADAANDDGEFLLAGRYLHAVLEISSETEGVELLIVDGTVQQVGPVGSVSADITRILIHAAEADWNYLLSPCPPPGKVGVSTAEGVSYEGDPIVRAAYYGAVRRIVELMSEQIHGARERPSPIDPVIDDKIIGRYVYVEVENVRYRVYFEESGSRNGVPLLMQHTAGSDNRQWRHVLNDPDYQRDFRLVAYDLPYHGKSSPPTSIDWWAREYMPTKKWLFEFVEAFSAAVEVNRPVFMGCSLGGLMAPVLARERPDQFRAVVGINAGAVEDPDAGRQADGQPQQPRPREQTPLAHLLDIYFHPHVGNDWKASGVLNLMAPTSPVAAQRETAWLYGSGAPPVFYGDCLSYATQFVLSEEQARDIDTSRVRVYFLTGEYDPFAISGAAQRLASWIAGSHHSVIAGAGHFAPSDSPTRFKEVLDPVLDEIKEQSRNGRGKSWSQPEPHQGSAHD